MSLPLVPSGLYRSSFPRDRYRYRASGEFRPPLRGEYYLWGKVPTVWQMLSKGCTTSYWIVRQVATAECPFCAGTGWIEASHD